MRKKEIHNENELVEGFRQGQRASFAGVFDLLYAPLCYYGLKITGNQAAAEDIAEDAFIKVWEKRELFFEFSKLKSYFYTTVKNASLNWLEKSRQLQSLNDDADYSLNSENNAAFAALAGAELLQRLSAAMRFLSPQGRQVITMLFLEGKKTRAVAEELGLSQSTVKTQKGRSLVKLRKHISL